MKTASVLEYVYMSSRIFFTIAATLTFVAACSRPAVPAHTPSAERLNSDTHKTTVEGNTFIAPAGWSIVVRGPATILEAPEGDSRFVLVDIQAKEADAAVAAAWAAYDPAKHWPLKVTTDSPDKDGWSNIRTYVYQTSPNERRDVAVQTRRSGDVWDVGAGHQVSPEANRRARPRRTAPVPRPTPASTSASPPMAAAVTGSPSSTAP